jgi:Holliday junction resolvasome RuvABC endonuclease subunit
VSLDCLELKTFQDNEVKFYLQCIKEKKIKWKLHAAHATNQGYSAIQTFSEENDLFIIAASMFMKSENKTLTKLVHVRGVAASVGIITHHVFIGMHSFTTYNAVFVGKGKACALNLRTGSADLLELPSCLDRNGK